MHDLRITYAIEPNDLVEVRASAVIDGQCVYSVAFADVFAMTNGDLAAHLFRTVNEAIAGLARYVSLVEAARPGRTVP